MKNPFLIFACATVALGQPLAGWAFVHPPHEQLPNYDIRAQGIAPVARAQAPAQQKAESLLRTRVPSLLLSTDGVLGTPRLISARKGFLTGVEGKGKGLSSDALASVPANDPHRVIKAFLNEHAALFGHDASVLNAAKINRDFVTAHNGLRTVVFQQTQNDIPVYESLLISHITRNGELVNVSDRFVPDLAAAAAAGSPDASSIVAAPPVPALRAISIAAANLDVQIDETGLSIDQEAVGPTQRQSAKHHNLFGMAHAELTWLPLNAGSMRLCWQVLVSARPKMEQFLILVDAQSGEMLLRRNLTSYAREQNYNVYTSDSPSPFSPGLQEPGTNQPAISNRTLVKITGALDTNASPQDWVYQGPTNNNTTFGNNVLAILDRDFDQLSDGPMPGGLGTNLTFNFPVDLTRDPVTYTNAAVAQLFYRANWFHDVMYGYGFTEAAGNFQTTNLNRGGLGRDEVLMLAQAGADVGYSDNAFFSTPPDGYNGLCAMFVWSYPRPNRDGALDSEIVIHELVHGLSNRLLGGGVGISQLQPGGMGEGWSDFYALSLLSEATDDPNAAYAAGGYVTSELYGMTENYYYGVRRYPYSTDLRINPLTFKDIDPTQASAHPGVPTSPVFGGGQADEVHNMGEVWCITLWEVRANLIEEVGWDQGNKLAIQLVTDGMKLAPPNATFIEARDAIIQADDIYTGGSFYEALWLAFAKRGMGADATAPEANTARGVYESFELPADIVTGPPDDILEVKLTPPANSVLFMADTNALYARVKDTFPVTNATVTAKVVTNNVTLKNDGTPPDFSSKDATYSANFVTPTNVPSVTIPVLVTAPGKTNSTNFVTYLLVAAPPNDMFANSLKMPSGGGSVFTSNKRASLEKGEPVHAGDSAASGSLWYNYVPPSSGDVLVDTAGSDFTTVVAVYTNRTTDNNISNLVSVASAVGNPSGAKGASVLFKGSAGAIYRIAIAGASSFDAGGLRLRVGQGLALDTNVPFASISYPQNGLTVTTNRMVVRGTAVDPEPQPSGIKQIKIAVSSGYGDSETVVYPTSSFDGPTSTNWSASVSLRPGVNKLFVTAFDYAGNQSTPATVQVTYRSIEPPNDFFALAQPITNISGVLSANTRNATKEIGEPNHAGVAGGKSAWWVFIAEEDGVLDLSTTNSTFDTVLAAYTGTNLSNLTSVDSNDDAYPYSPNGFSYLDLPVKAGTTYWIAVDGYAGAGGAMFLSYSFVPQVLYHLTLSSSVGGSVNAPRVDVHSNDTVIVTATAAAGYTFSMWSGDVVSLANPLSLTVRSNVTLTAQFVPASLITDDFETGDLAKIAWITSGNVPWSVQSAVVDSGVYAARSGAIQGNQVSVLQLTSNFRTDDGSFDLKVSSESVWDRLTFSIDGALQQQWSGDLNWRNFAFSLVAGTHTLEWRYSKDASGSAGLDAVFIDNIRLPIAEPINSTTPAHLSLLSQTDGNYYIELLGQTNQIYTLQSSTNLVNWIDVTAPTAATVGVLRFYDPAAVGTQGTRYYRAVTP